MFKASGRKKRLFRMSPIHHHFELARLAGDDRDHPLLADRRDVCVAAALGLFIGDFTRISAGMP